jgi:hypothetical protein
VARRIYRSLALLLAFTGSAAAADTRAETLLREAAEAVRANRREAAFFIYQERVTEREIAWDGKVRQSGANGYEVIFIEGESYHKRTMLNGKPLSGAAREEEERRMQAVADFRRNTSIEERRRRLASAERTRLRFDISIIADNHLVRFEREEECPGGPCLVIAVWPKPGTRRPRHPNEWSLSLRGHLWLDAGTSHPLRAELEQAYDYHGQAAGTRTRFRWTRVEGVWLIESITSIVEARTRQVAVRELVQEYSSYQRFQAESVLVFHDDY